CARDPYAMDYW
nr:immunoglobulin heavy chain junction region [Mus musculus]MBK4188867.1 immunoglobulin heavy chain junction region [Mus musculus]MBK4196670.1 immunoglobulin heavy chain junction region [Mus musculus]MBK4196674.1 immunoglobulin heavy chain junction region [Mus musculus]